VATILIGTWVKEIDGKQVDEVLSGRAPFDEQTMIAGHGEPVAESATAPSLANA